MNMFRKHPLELLLLLIIIYSIFFTSDWSGKDVNDKMFSFSVIAVTGGILLLFKIAWPELVFSIKEMLSDYISAKFLTRVPEMIRVLFLFPFALILLMIVTIIEFFLYLILFKRGSVIIGYPYPIYSYSVNKFLLNGMLLDAIFYSAVIYLIVKVTKNKAD